jgi:hypothetical protein
MSDPHPRLLPDALLTASVLGAECMAVYWLMLPEGFYLAVPMHLAVMLLVLIWVVQGSGRSRLAPMLLLAAAVTGPFGAAICMVACMVYASSPRAASPSEWITALLPQEESIDDAKRHERIALGLDDLTTRSNVEPFQDILNSGTVVQKQMAIAKITRYFQPAFAPLLLQAVQDANAAVRVQAATALAKLERDFMTEYMKLEKTIKELPVPNPAKLQLADLCDDYAYAGLTDSQSRDALRSKAIGIYEACMTQEETPELRLRLARLYLKQGMPEKTCEMLGSAIESGKAPTTSIPWYMEALFRLGKLSHVHNVARRFGDRLPQDIKDRLGIWHHALSPRHT